MIINIVKVMMVENNNINDSFIYDKNNNIDDSFIYDKNNKVAKIRYQRFNVKHDLYLPFDKSKQSYKKIQVFAKIPVDIIDMDSTTHCISDDQWKSSTGIEQRNTQEKYKMMEITQQYGIPYMVTADTFGADYIEVIETETGRRKNKKTLGKFFKNEQIKF